MSDKMRTKILAVLFSLIIIIVVFGCKGPGGGRGPTAPEEDFRRGTEGIELTFLRLPSRIYAEDDVWDDEELQIDLELKNKGAFPQPDIETLNGDVYLSGFDDTIIVIDRVDAHKDMDSGLLEGKNIYNDEGGRDIMHFTGDISLEGKNIDSDEQIIMATACYEYMTTGNIPVCIDPDPYEITSEKKVCTVPTSYSIGSGSQGAPVAITKVEEEIMSNRIQFRIYIKNSGRGDVIHNDKLEDCNPYLDELRFSDMDIVYLEEVSVSGQDISSYNCKPKDRYIKLYNGEGRIYCDYTPAEGFDKAKPAYKTPLVIRLAYVYRSSITKDIEIVRVR